MKQEAAKERAKLNDSGIIDSRRLANSHRRLAEILKPGMTVLDIGCGTGAISSGIAEAVGPDGRVVGIDNNPELIEKARHNYNQIPGLTFETGDIYDLPFNEEFDIVTSARVLQWLSNPQDALKQMVQSVKRNGIILVLDYNHTKIKWEPEPPESMKGFYHAFLNWRSDAGMDNEIADHLKAMFKKEALTDIDVTIQSEVTDRKDETFQTSISIWASVAESRGVQMVNDGYITETQRLEAVIDYQDWVKNEAESQTMYLLAVEGIKKN